MSDVLLDKETSHHPETLLLRAYKQWIDLARSRNEEEILTITDEGSLPRHQLWMDEDNAEIPIAEVSPILAGESLLCFLLPAIAIDEYSPFAIRRKSEDNEQDILTIRTVSKHLSYNPDQPNIKPPTSDKPLDARHFINILEVIDEYYTLTTTGNGEPRFTGGSYFDFSNLETPSFEEIENTPIVDAYSIGLSVAVRVLYLIRRLSTLRLPESRDKQRLRALSKKIEPGAKAQLKGCLNGLKDSFVVYHISNEEWESLDDNRYNWEDLASTPEIQHLEEQLMGLGHDTVMPNEHFECGWTWGPVSEQNSETESAGEPERAPYLYFTWTALAAIADFYDEHLQIESMLDDEDFPLVIVLKRFAELTTSYWSLLAGQVDNKSGRSRALSVPWITTDRDASPYYSLYLLGIIFSTMSLRSAQIAWTLEVLEELAQRGRITTRHLVLSSEPEPIVRELHRPGKKLELSVELPDGSISTFARWRVYDYAPLLLKVTAQVRNETSTYAERNRVNQLIDAILKHLDLRQADFIELNLAGSPARDQSNIQKIFEQDYGIWDAYQNFDSTSDEVTARSWYFSQRVVEALVTCITQRPRRISLPTVEALVQEMITYLDDRYNIAAELRSAARESPVRALTEVIIALIAEFEQE